MTSLISLLSALVLCITLTSCDNPLITGVEQDIDINNSIENTEKSETITDLIIDSNPEEYSSNHLDDWVPRITRTPLNSDHNTFHLPIGNIDNLRSYFHKVINTKKVRDGKLFENEVILYGHIQYLDSTTMYYDFEKNNEEYLGKEFYLAGNYELRQKLTGSYKDTVYKMLEISGVDNPDQFLQQLLASPKITKYTGCTVQLKPVKYGVIDLTSCEDDDATVLALYNPKLI